MFPNPGLDRFGACFLVRFDLVFDLLDAVDAAEQVGYQRGSFLSAELVDAVEGFGYGAAKCRQFFVGNGFCTVSGSFKMAVIAAASAAALPQPSPLASASSRSCPA